MSEAEKTNITVLLPAGRLPLDIMESCQGFALKYGLRVYLTTLQNLRLIGVPQENADEIRAALAELGADFKGPGKFPLARICVGKVDCTLGVVDTELLNKSILERFSARKKTKAKFKIALAGCTMCCSNVKTTDIGVMATREGFEVFAGGKGGPFPKVGRRIARKIDEGEVLDIIAGLVDFHDRKTEKKQRMFKLLTDPEFPYPEV